MAEYIVMPKLGFDMREGEFNAWNIDVGGEINRGDVVAEIESDKATLEVEAQATGVLLATLVEPGDIVAVGENIGIIGEEGEDVSDMMGGGEAEEEEASTAEPEETSSADETASTESKPVQAADTKADSKYPGGVKATPVARRMAKEHEIDLLNVPFEGERVRKADVEAYLEAGAPEPQKEAAVAEKKAAPTQTMQVEPTYGKAGPNDEVIPASKLRRAIARRMVESKTTVPHFQVTMELEMDEALALRKRLNGMLADEGVKISINDILVKAAGVALVDFPMLNASFAGDEIILRGDINVGSAVSTDNGLLTVVQKNTDKSTLGEIAKQNKAMVTRARSGKINPDDVEGGTFTLSNLGVYGVAEFVAIINPPEAAIMAIGGINDKLVLDDGEVKASKRMNVTVSADHRVTDGAEVAEFLVRYKELIENPMRLLV